MADDKNTLLVAKDSQASNPNSSKNQARIRYGPTTAPGGV